MKEPRHLTASEVKVGMQVGLWNGVQINPAEVIEDAGNVGYRGRRIFRLRVAASDDPDGGLEFDAALDNLVELPPHEKPIRRPRAPRQPTAQTG